jgi:hypothetical protein
MKNEILNNLNDPAYLEKTYRSNKVSFRREFSTLYPELKDNKLADFWHERLSYESDEISWGTSRDLTFVIIIAIIAGIIAKIPSIFSINYDFYYPRNIGFIVFPVLSIYFARKNNLSAGKFAFIAGTTLAGLLFINFLPDAKTSDTLILSCLHLILFLWAVLGFAFVGNLDNDDEKRLWYLKYNGDLVVMTTLILIAGVIMSLITVGLFSLIGFDIKEFYFENIAVFGLAAAPVAGTYLTQTNPQLVGKVSPVIAKIFSPLVLVMLVIYLGAMIYSGKDPYNDRQFLIVFNALLVGVMAIIFFSVAETAKSAKNHAEVWILFLLSAVTLLVNGIALSAIIFRISEFGITPNRTAVLGSNILILFNLILVTRQLFLTITKRAEISGVGKAIAFCLPVYFIWTVIVTFLFPLIFVFK